MAQELVTLPREVVELAMNALEFSETQSHRLQYDVEASALAALSAALEQPQGEQEPVRKMYVCNSCQFPYSDQPPSQCDCLGDETYTEAYLCTNLQPNQPQDDQEPVAWMYGVDGEDEPRLHFYEPLAANNVSGVTPLYTHPQPKREPLTDEQIAAATGAKPGTRMWIFISAITRAIERAHNINHEGKEA
jgi:hypothetical protein